MQFSKHLPLIVLGSAIVAVALIFSVPMITGRDWPSWTGLQGKTLWDLAALIVVPISLALIAYLFNNSQRLEERNIAEQRRSNDSEIALNREREAALESYLSEMTSLLLDYDVNDSKVATIAQARTLNLLPRLDEKRRVAVLGFLAQTNLISAQSPMIRLSGANLSKIVSTGIDLTGANLAGTNLSNSRLANGHLRNTNLSGSNLTGVDFSNADLYQSIFKGANLTGTVFSDANIYGADFSSPPSKPHMNQKIAYDRAKQREKDWLEMLAKAQFQRARYDHSTKWPAGFRPEGAIDESD